MKEESSITVCGSASGRTATQTDLNQAMTMLWELRAVQAQLKDDAENAERYILKAIELESNTTFIPMAPWDIVKPFTNFTQNGFWKTSVTMQRWIIFPGNWKDLLTVHAHSREN
ncbi:MAG: hypothetical protein R3B93_12005 [Bacteroidia bacterium]